VASDNFARFTYLQLSRRRAIRPPWPLRCDRAQRSALTPLRNSSPSRLLHLLILEPHLAAHPRRLPRHGRDGGCRGHRRDRDRRPARLLAPTWPSPPSPSPPPSVATVGSSTSRRAGITVNPPDPRDSLALTLPTDAGSLARLADRLIVLVLLANRPAEAGWTGRSVPFGTTISPRVPVPVCTSPDPSCSPSSSRPPAPAGGGPSRRQRTCSSVAPADSRWPLSSALVTCKSSVGWIGSLVGPCGVGILLVYLNQSPPTWPPSNSTSRRGGGQRGPCSPIVLLIPYAGVSPTDPGAFAAGCAMLVTRP